MAVLVYISTHLSGAQLASPGLDIGTLMSAVTKPADRVAFAGDAVSKTNLIIQSVSYTHLTLPTTPYV